MADVVSLRARGPNCGGDWSNEELAQLYRVEHVLVQAGIAVAGDRGLTDEDDPWFVFVRDDGTVIVHIARFDGLYRIYSSALRTPLTGRSFAEVTKSFAAGLPVLKADDGDRSITRHPMALLSMLVATICLVLENHGEPSAPLEKAASEFTSERDATTLLARHWPGSARSVGSAGEPGSWVVLSAVHAVATTLAWGFIGEAAAMADGGEEVAAAEFEVTGLEAAIPAVPGGAHAADEFASSGAVGDHDAQPLVDDLRAEVTPTEDVLGDVVDPLPSVAGTAPTTPFAPTPGAASEIAIPAAPEVGAGRTVELDGEAPPAPLVLAAGALVVTVAGRGALTVSEADAGLLTLVFGADSRLALTVEYRSPGEAGAADGTARLALEVALQGNAVGEIAVGGTVKHVTLSIESSGAMRNEITLREAPPDAMIEVALHGDQDVVMHQSRDVRQQIDIDARDLGGTLLFGVDLSARETVSPIIFDSTNFKGDADASIVLVNVPKTAEVRIGIDLMRLIVDTVAEGDRAADTARVMLLEAEGGVDIGLLSVNETAALTLAVRDGHHRIGVLEASNLAALVLTGVGDVAIDRIVGIDARHGQDIVVDARDLTGAMSLDLTAIAEMAGRTITVIGGGGDDTIVVDSVDGGAVLLSGGDGSNTFKLAAGSISYVISDLKPGDKVVVGNGTTRSTIASALEVDATAQRSIDDTVSLADAAAIAHGLLAVGAESQSLLFNYHGDRYVFVDLAGDGRYSSTDDVIVKVTGLASVDLDGVFHTT